MEDCNSDLFLLNSIISSLREIFAECVVKLKEKRTVPVTWDGWKRLRNARLLSMKHLAGTCVDF